MTDCESIARACGLRPCGNQWRGPCPVHGGTGEAFVLRERDDGQPLVYCHAGCAFREIVTALRAEGLWPEPDEDTRAMWRERKRDEDIERAKRLVLIAHEAGGEIVDRFGQDYRWARKVLRREGYTVRRGDNGVEVERE